MSELSATLDTSSSRHAIRTDQSQSNEPTARSSLRFPRILLLKSQTQVTQSDALLKIRNTRYGSFFSLGDLGETHSVERAVNGMFILYCGRPSPSVTTKPQNNVNNPPSKPAASGLFTTTKMVKVISVKQRLLGSMLAFAAKLLQHTEAGGELLMAEEMPGAWLHLTGDPWMTPEDILSDRPSSFTSDSERSRIKRSSDSSIDTLPPYSPLQNRLPSPKQDFDVESDTLLSPLLSPTLRKEDEVENMHDESMEGIKRSRRSRMGIASKSKPRMVHLHHDDFQSTVGSSSAGISFPHEIEHRMEDSGNSHHMPKKSKVKGVQPIMGVESMFSTADSCTRFKLYDPIGLANGKKDRMPGDSPGYPLTPIELDLGALSMIATLPDPASRTPTKARLRSTPILTLVTPEQSAWQRHVYLPGTIRLGTSFVPPSTSTLTYIDLLPHSTATFDDTVLDEIVDYFLSFGLSDLEPFLSETQQNRQTHLR